MSNSLQKNTTHGFSLFRFFLITILTTFAISIIHFTNEIIAQSEVKSLIAQISRYDNAIKNFTIKYQGLPGDLKNTKTYGITTKNTDGDFNNLITDKNQNITSANGEIVNFWLHLSSAKMLEEKFDGKSNKLAKTGKTFPTSNIGKSVGIIAFGADGVNYYQIGFDFANEKKIFTKQNSLKSEEAFLFDKKIDDGIPNKGHVIAAGGDSLNILTSSKCTNFNEYDLSSDQPSCQLRIEIGKFNE